jgi:uncharacterized protein
MLVFIAADSTNAEAWEKALCEYLAWKSIDEQSEELNLDAQQRKQVATMLKRTDETVQSRLQETYSWLIVPSQPEATGAIEYQAFRISGDDSFYERALRKLRSAGQLISQWSPDTLRMELDQLLWRDQEHLNIKLLWEYLARYCYLPRLHNEQVLRDAIQAGVERGDVFGYASHVSEDGYKGLVLGRATSIYFDGNDVIVRPEIAREILEQIEANQAQIVTKPQPQNNSTDGRTQNPVEPAKPKVVTRYHGTVELDPQRVNREMGMIVEEIIQRLTSLTGTDVEITLEISASRPAGFEDATIRTINENSRTLKFKNHGFED